MNPCLKNSFDHDYEMWHAYDYAACAAAGGRDLYRPAHWEQRGGVNDSGYIWADEAQWSIDTPEQPPSILALMTWRQWMLRGPLDLRQATISVFLRGDELDLKGGRCSFWVLSRGLSARYHLTGQPVTVARDKWGDEPCLLNLKHDEAQWHRSWTVPGQRIPTMGEVLGEVDSYGFAFVGFSEQVIGRLCMDEFEIKLSA